MIHKLVVNKWTCDFCGQSGLHEDETQAIYGMEYHLGYCGKNPMNYRCESCKHWDFAQQFFEPEDLETGNVGESRKKSEFRYCSYSDSLINGNYEMQCYEKQNKERP